MAQPVSPYDNVRKWGALACLATGSVLVAPIALRCGSDLISTVAPIPNAILGALGNSIYYVGSNILGAAGRFIVKDYGPAASRYALGKSLENGDSATLAMGTALAISIMFLGCFCFGSKKKS